MSPSTHPASLPGSHKARLNLLVICALVVMGSPVMVVVAQRGAEGMWQTMGAAMATMAEMPADVRREAMAEAAWRSNSCNADPTYSLDSPGESENLFTFLFFFRFSPKCKGVPTKLWLGVGFISTQSHLPPKFSFSSDFGHFILKILENAKIYVLRKKILKYPNFCGGRPRGFLKCGGTPATPVGDAPAEMHYLIA